ncbi:LuxR C-terminal-related transcriptional regulator [Pararhizobium sp. PWRC1-1]|uniref:LuxR C-terminal-related transcriptional regulator n=1 Tax=Pararhizobium sp. PWRC1-1 TaxID=2804566 RepID=UPI003CE987B0
MASSTSGSSSTAALHALRRGDVYVADDVRFAVHQEGVATGSPEPRPAIASPVDLTRREWQMLALIPHGVTTRDIAERLGISPLTARKHRENLMRKLDLHSGAELTAYAIRLGLPAG